MADPKGNTNAPEVAETLRQKLGTLKKQLKLQMFRALTTLEKEIIQNVRSNSGLHVRTGALLNSISSSKKVTQESDGTIVGQIGSVGVPYGRIREFGGVIRPKDRQYLAIPTQENQKSDGSPIVTTGRLMTLQKLGLAFVRDGVIYQRIMGPLSQPKPMFVLKKSVTQKATPFLRPALVAKQDEIMKNFGVFISAALKSEGGSRS